MHKISYGQVEFEITDKVIQRFESKIKVDTETGCWNWIAGTDEKGYGRLGLRNNNKAYPVLSHRIIYSFIFGNPEGMCVLHKCDNSLCNNPHHLTIGTQLDNLADMEFKGRSNRTGPGKNKYCKSGRHILDEKNTYIKIRKTKNGKTTMSRSCRQCNNEQQKKWQRRNRPTI